MKPRRRILPFAIAAAVLWIGSTDLAGRSTGGTRADMYRLFDDVSTVFRLSLDAERFRDPNNRDRILESLVDLAATAEHLGDHGERPQPSYDFLGRSLVRDANEAVLRFRQGHYDGSRFLLGKLFNNCFDCHSRLPSDGSFPAGVEFLETVDTGSLAPAEIARLEVVTRQFGRAMDTYEGILVSPDTPAAQLAVSGVFEEYFRVGLRVECDYDRVLECLERFNRRPDVPPYLRGRVNRWYTDLKVIRKAERRADGDLLDRGRRLLRDAQYGCEFPNDPRGMVQYVVASGYVMQYLQRDFPADTLDVVESYYLLGVAESNISHSYWSSETEALLEKAIRTAPESVFGRMAFNFLEEYTVRGYTGSAGVHIPPEVQDRLDELRTLVESGGP